MVSLLSFFICSKYLNSVFYFLFNLAILNFCKTPNFIIKVNNLIKIKWHNWLAKNINDMYVLV